MLWRVVESGSPSGGIRKVWSTIHVTSRLICHCFPHVSHIFSHFFTLLLLLWLPLEMKSPPIIPTKPVCPLRSGTLIAGRPFLKSTIGINCLGFFCFPFPSPVTCTCILLCLIWELIFYLFIFSVPFLSAKGEYDSFLRQGNGSCLLNKWMDSVFLEVGILWPIGVLLCPQEGAGLGVVMFFWNN